MIGGIIKMAKTYTLLEDRTCIQELPAYRNHMKEAKKRGKGRHGEIFTKTMLEKYHGVWNDRTESGLYLHMEYLDDLTAGRREAGRIKDQGFYGILMEEDETVDHILFVEEPAEESDVVTTNHSEGTYQLSSDEIEKLLAFVGFGNREKSNILFFGNEEGLGGYELHHAIKAKCAVYGNNEHSYITQNWRDGFYEIPEVIDPEYKKVMKELRGELLEETSLFSPMLEFQARIALHLQDPEQDWFSKREDNPENFEVIKKYYQTSLYHEDSKFPLSLMDLRPFPRRNEKDEWPYSNIDRSQYLRAFSFNPSAKIDPLYQELRDKRASILKRAIECSNANFIVGIGDKESKRRFFEQVFSTAERPLQFEEVKLTKDKCEVYKTSLILKNRTITVLLSDFFDYRNIGLAGLEKLTKEHIPVLNVTK